jgi:hypothetical protein
MITLGSYLIEHTTTRAGIIPYTIADSKIYFWLAKHRQTGEYGDFGGGVRKYETPLVAAIREFTEESKNIFDIKLTANDLVNKIIMVDHSMTIVFYPLPSLNIGLKEEFFRKSAAKDEISELKWLDEDALLRLIRGSGRDMLWKKIANFIGKCYCDKFSKALRLVHEHHL